MKFTLAWLKDHLETEASLADILEALTDLGLEVEGAEDPTERLGAFRVGYVVAAEKHPDADKLKVCRVDTGGGAEQQIICGAPNARAGIKVVVAAPGDYIPGIDTTIQVGKIRGVESFGMMLSEREMELSDAHDGIVELPEDAEIGARYVDIIQSDPVIDIAITPNRPDALGVRGVARDLAARGLGVLKPVDEVRLQGSFPCPIGVTIAPDLLEKGCPHFAGRVIRGVKNGPSPDWLQARLRAIGLRPISALVDVTNFFTYDRNRPLHVFDAAMVVGNIEVHSVEAPTEIVALDDKTYVMQPGMMAIADANGPESIAGVMGGLSTGCTEETTEVFVESAYWDPVTIAATGRALRINSDARYRFERGVDPDFTEPGLDLACQMIVDLCGGEVSEKTVAGAPLDTARFYPLRPERLRSLVGLDISEAEQIRILTALGFGVAREHGGIEVWVPSWRPDVHGEADLVEEVARVASLTRLEGRPMTRPAGVSQVGLTLAQRREKRLRLALASAGLNECVTYSFIDQPTAALFGGGSEDVALANPISTDLSHMRPSALPGLLRVAARNQARGMADLALFEVGPAFAGGEPDDQSRQGVGVRTGQDTPRTPYGARRPVDVFDAKADAEAALRALGAPERLMVLRKAPEWYHPGRSGVLSLGPKTPLAIFGELHPRVLSAMDVKGPAVAVQIFPDALPQPRSTATTRPALDISDLQAVERDFAFVVDADLEADRIVKAALGVDKALIERAYVFDVFAGPEAEKQMGEGKKSVAISVRLQPKDTTLTDKDIEALSERLVATVGKATGAQLRG